MGWHRLVFTTFILLSISRFLPLFLCVYLFFSPPSLHIEVIPSFMSFFLYILYDILCIYVYARCMWIILHQTRMYYYTKSKCGVPLNVRERERECLQHHKHHSNKRLLMHTHHTQTRTHTRILKYATHICPSTYTLPRFHFALTHSSPTPLPQSLTHHPPSCTHTLN